MTVVWDKLLNKALLHNHSSNNIEWGDITGTLSNQTDLQTTLDAKVTANTPIVAATKTKITYDTDGLVTAGADATTTDITEGINLYYTDARARAAITGTTNRITVTSGVVDIAPTYTGQSSITTLGTIATGVWQGTAIGGAYIDYNTTNLKVTSSKINTIQDIATTSSPTFVGLTLTSDLSVQGNTTLGDAAGDIITINATTLTFAGDTNIGLSGGVNGLSFDTDTLSIDATNNRIGVGTTAPVSSLDVSTTSTSNPRGLTIAQFNTGTSSAIVTLRKSRGSSIGTNTIVNSGDSIGSIIAAGADGTNFVQAGYIQFQVDGTPGTNDMPGRIIFATTPDGSSAGVERMRITKEGYVGIGATPTNLFTVSGTVVDSTNATLMQVTASTNSSSNNQIGANFTVNAGPTSASSQIYFGMNFSVQSVTNNANGELQAFRGGSLHAGTNTLTTASGGVFVNTNYSSGTITDSIALRAENVVKVGGTVTNNIGVYVSAMSSGTNNAGQMIGEATGSNSANLIIGQLTIPTGQFSIYNSSSDNNYFNGNTGFGTSTPTSFKVEVAGNIGPDGNKTRDLGSTTKRWNNIFYVTATTGTSRLVETSVLCPECNQFMFRGTGVDITLGEDFDFTEVYCFDCNRVGIEKFKHLAEGYKSLYRPCPKIILKNMVAQNLSGHTRTIRVDFLYQEEQKNELGEIVEPIIENSTVLSEKEISTFFSLTDDERIVFLQKLGQREWDALEEVRLMKESLSDDQVQFDILAGGILGKDLMTMKGGEIYE